MPSAVDPIEQATFGPFRVVYGKGEWHVSNMGRIVLSHPDKGVVVDAARELSKKFDSVGRYIITEADREQARLFRVLSEESGARIRARRLAVRRRA